MPRFFVRADQIEEIGEKKRIIIKGEDAHHISHALRMAKGEKIEVCDMQKNVYECEICDFSSDEVTTLVLGEKKADTEPKCAVKLYQALPKGDKFENIIQKSVECGVSEIIPFISERCIAKLDKKDAPKKLARWQKISESAAKQCGRGIIPEIKEPLSYKEMLDSASKEELFIFCYEGDGTKTLKEILRPYNGHVPEKISLVVGAEGGFSVNEAELASQYGAKMAGLGKRILRCETASPFALACIAYETEF